VTSGGPGGRCCRRLALWAAAPALLALAVRPVTAAPQRAVLEPGLVAVRTDQQLLFVEAEPRGGEGLLAFSRRVTGDERAASAIAAANGGLRRLLTGRRYRVPSDLLAPTLRLRAARALFLADRPEWNGWRHLVSAPDGREPEVLWRIAEWFTGKGENFSAIREYNRLDDEPLVGAAVVIPAELLLPVFRETLPPRPVAAVAAAVGAGPVEPPLAMAATQVAPVPSVADPVSTDVTTVGGSLRFHRDEVGEYAVYALAPGEALYSSVVVRFTGRIHAEDVNALAQDIATRSGIQDVTDIPVGYPVKVPLDLLQPEFLPPTHPRRVEYEASRQASARFRNHVEALDLEGVTVILDAGHGGRDVGASLAGVWESLYVYDVMVRVRRLLDEYTAARVVATTREGQEWKIADQDVLEYSRGHAVLTTPPYPIEDSKVGVNLRWYLANAVENRSRSVAEADKIIFISIHADSLHPSLRGAMAYVPDANLSGGSLTRSGAEYASRKEVREARRSAPSRQQLQRFEGLSRDLAQHVIAAFAAEKLAVHPEKPVRERVIRGRRAWVPAVLRYNSVPAKILLEVCNLANREDRALLQTRAHRQHIAEAVVRGILDYYAPTAGASDTKLARASR
jgi:N-acetylmuramoyl-L-alanine amidase